MTTAKPPIKNYINQLMDRIDQVAVQWMKLGFHSNRKDPALLNVIWKDNVLKVGTTKFFEFI